MIDVMLDLETMGTTRGSAIASIAAATFDLESGWIVGGNFYTVVDLGSATRAGLTCDGRTVAWWLAQSDAARKQLTEPYQTQPIGDALIAFRDWYMSISGQGALDLSIWAKDPDMDLVVLAGAFEAVWSGRSLPWGYRAGRSVRTIEDLARRTGWEPPARDPGLVAHDAVADVTHQIASVSSAWRWLRGLR